MKQKYRGLERKRGESK